MASTIICTRTSGNVVKTSRLVGEVSACAEGIRKQQRRLALGDERQQRRRRRGAGHGEQRHHLVLLDELRRGRDGAHRLVAVILGDELELASVRHRPASLISAKATSTPSRTLCPSSDNPPENGPLMPTFTAPARSQATLSSQSPPRKRGRASHPFPDHAFSPLLTIFLYGRVLNFTARASGRPPRGPTRTRGSARPRSSACISRSFRSRSWAARR